MILLKMNFRNAMDSQKTLTQLRRTIEQIDKQIIALFAKRFRTVQYIQALKSQIRVPIRQKKREKHLLKIYINLAKGYGIPPQTIEKLFRLIFSYSKKADIIK